MSYDGRSLLGQILEGMQGADPEKIPSLTHAVELSARKAATAAWPSWAFPTLVRALHDSGIHEPWTHQAAAASLAASGQDVIVATGTASGKSLAYQMPVLTTLANDPSATALYLAPTKALAVDQLRSILDLTEAAEFGSVLPAAYDGDASLEARQWARAHSRWIFTNPDMLHLGILGAHDRWARLLRNLRYVIIDESHHYRGVFGAGVALVLRRLRRVAARHGAIPTFILASATAANPAESASLLTGTQVVAVTDDGSPRPARTIALWEPPLQDRVPGRELSRADGENGAPVRRPAGAEAARIMAELVIKGVRTLTFVRSRFGAELTAISARRIVAATHAELADRVASYRAGYLAEDRRALEAALSTGELIGVATTNALELGVDIVGLDAVVMAGFPGTVASFWQQAGRAGRTADTASYVVLVARDDPLDTYLVHHPAALLDKPLEATVLDPHNPFVLGPHLLCAAAEMPLTDAEVHSYGAWDLLTELADQGLIRRREHGWFVASDIAPHTRVDLRGTGGHQIAIIEGDTGRVLGTSDVSRAPATLHAGAVHLHRGESYVVDTLDLDGGVALVHAETPDWTTTAREVTRIAIVTELASRAPGQGVTAALVEVDVTHQVTGYVRMALSGELLDICELDMPVQTLPTRAVMYTLDPDVLARAGVPADRVAGALHAAEHAAIGLLPLIATCDRGDIGGLSTARHPDTGLPTVFVYDGYPGGAGFADRGYADLTRWLTATAEAIADCECPSGCPSCVQSPKCGNGNTPLDKRAAVTVLRTVRSALG